MKARLAAALLLATSAHVQAAIPTTDPTNAGNLASMAMEVDSVQLQNEMVNLQKELARHSRMLFRLCLQQQTALWQQGVEPTQPCIAPIVPAAPERIPQ